MRAKAQGVYAPHAAMISDISVHEGQSVAADAILVRLFSPELEYPSRKDSTGSILPLAQPFACASIIVPPKTTSRRKCRDAYCYAARVKVLPHRPLAG
jgi:hypothetical protein